ncbi:AAA family ATPase [Nocardia otitidiscaviarum]|uniref:BTAD domain-containing putative transcriptional regulator n=1 Tax=Nocardia otitidiscaviarum TaxID=1823 RepID=UPI00189603BC|nr:BTAD domain-containing putative transcriptional regulator [Nocardia otitidiscaviarum]MBF6236434.1 AAA family ATPase [Nocardia otitidiscaviarum]
MADIRIILLDGVQVLRDGHAVSLGPPQRRALLAALALRRRRWVSAGVLLNGLYDDDAPASGTGLVQTHISALRRALEPDRAPRATPTVLLSGHGGYQLRIADDHIDVGVFDRLMAEAEQARAQSDWRAADQLYTRALRLCVGEPLTGLPGPAAAAQRALLQERCLSALEDSLFVALRLDRVDQVLDRARTLVSEQPLRERSASLLMRALVRQGRRTEALDVYSRTRRRLVDELGVEPGDELRELQRRILDGRPVAEPAQPEPPPVGVAPTTASAAPLVDRDGPLTTIAAAHDRALRGSGGTLVVSGYPGSGKTAVLQAAAARISHAVLLSGSELGPEPRLFPALAAALGVAPGDSGPVPDDRCEQVSRLRAALEADPRPRVVFIDDLTRAGAGAVDLLVALTPVLRRFPILLVTVLDERAWYPTPVSEAHTSLECLAIEIIRLPALRVSAVSVLTERALGHTSETLALEIHQATGGLPILVAALLRDLALLDGSGRVPDHLPGGTYLRAVHRQLGAYSEAGVRMLYAIAVIQDHDAPLDVVAAASEQSGNEVRERCALLVDQAILASIEPPRLRHALPAATLRRLCPADLAQRIRVVAAQRATLLSFDSRTVARYLSELSGPQWSQWSPTLIDAAAEAVRALALPEATAHLEVARRIAPAEQRDDILVRIGLLKQWTDPVAAHSCLESALAGQRAAKTAPTALIPLAWTLVAAQRPQEAEDLLDAVIDETAARDTRMATTLRASRWMITGLTAHAWNAYVERARRDPAPDTVTAAVLLVDDIVAVRISSEEARARFPIAAEPNASELVPPELVGVLAHIALWRDSLALAGRLSDHGDDKYFGLLDTYRLILRTEVLLRQARYTEAERLCGLVTVHPPGVTVRRPAGPVALYAHALLGSGRIDEARRWLESTRVQGNPESWEWCSVIYVRGLVCAAQGLAREAVGHFVDCGRRLAAWNQHNPAQLPWRSSAALQLVSVGEYDDARRLAAEELRLAERWNTPATVGRAWRAVALAAADGTTVELLLRAVEYLRRAESTAELIAALIDLADAYLADQRIDAARDTLLEAQPLAHPTNAAWFAAQIAERLDRVR